MKTMDWDIHRHGRPWVHELSVRRVYKVPEEIEFVDGIFATERERLIVLGMLLESLGIDKVVRLGKLEDWKAAIEDLEKEHSSGNQP